jgi:hypothetical protein
MRRGLGSRVQNKTTWERVVTELGNIFDYQMSAMVFGYMTIGFIAAYGLVAVWAAGHAKSGDRALQAA